MALNLTNGHRGGGTMLAPMAVESSSGLLLPVTSSVSMPMAFSFQPTLAGYYQVPSGVAMANPSAAASFAPMYSLSQMSASMAPPMPVMASMSAMRAAPGGEALCGGLSHLPLDSSTESATVSSAGGHRSVDQIKDHFWTANDAIICKVVESVPNPSKAHGAKVLVALRNTCKKFQPTLAGQIHATECKEQSSLDGTPVGVGSVAVTRMRALPTITAPSVAPTFELAEPRSAPPMPVAPSIFLKTRNDFIGRKPLFEEFVKVELEEKESNAIKVEKCVDGEEHDKDRDAGDVQHAEVDEDLGAKMLPKPVNALAKELSPSNAVPLMAEGTPDVVDLSEALVIATEPHLEASKATASDGSSQTLEFLLAVAKDLGPQSVEPPLALSSIEGCSVLSLPPLEASGDDTGDIPQCECDFAPEWNGEHIATTKMDAMQSDSHLGGELVSSEEVLDACVELSSKGPFNGGAAIGCQPPTRRRALAAERVFENRLAMERTLESGRYFRGLNGAQSPQLVSATGDALYGHRDFVDGAFFRKCELLARYKKGKLRLAAIKEPMRSHLKWILAGDRCGQRPPGYQKILRPNRAATAEFFAAVGKKRNVTQMAASSEHMDEDDSECESRTKRKRRKTKAAK